MPKLDQLKRIKKFDQAQVVDSIDGTAMQAEQAWEEVQKMRLPASFKKATHVLVCAMGGSHLGTDIIKSIYDGELTVPITVQSDYHLPGWVNKNTLVVVISYSGNTEEAIQCYDLARKAKAPTMVISSGGKLHRKAKKDKVTNYIFTPHYNPSEQPRIGVGYTLFAQLALFAKIGIIPVTANQIQDATHQLKFATDHFGIRSPFKRNNAKQMAMRLAKKNVLLFSAEHLVGNTHIFANQLNETAKQLAAWFPVPELNHHLLEGLKYPNILAKSVTAILFHSNFYNPRNSKRMKLTATVVHKNKINVINYYLTPKNKLNQAMEVLSLSTYVTFYLAILNKEDPTDIPWVDWFKDELVKKDEE